MMQAAAKLKADKNEKAKLKRKSEKGSSSEPPSKQVKAGRVGKTGFSVERSRSQVVCKSSADLRTHVRTRTYVVSTYGMHVHTYVRTYVRT